MSKVADLGDRILSFQVDLGLANPRSYRTGLSDAELRQYPMLLDDRRARNELDDLFAWRNGTLTGDIPMGNLWIIPGYYLLSASESLAEQMYLSRNLPDWSDSWYPILTNGSATRYFCDLQSMSAYSLPVLYYDPECSPVAMIYDGIESMFATILECYARRAFFVGQGGFLDSDFRQEVEISKRLNPASSYWNRKDLF